MLMNKFRTFKKKFHINTFRILTFLPGAHNKKDLLLHFQKLYECDKTFFKHNSCCMVRHLCSEIMLKGFVTTPPLPLCFPSTENNLTHQILEENKNYFKRK